ncbi:MAG: hypothetical protein HOJ22_08360 [Chloroflexi bacterium]|jgi:hypothetical protein|nr:hypothetical protein [Chloroflexota bacterium]MBT5628290.1 hypothetical protein [Chloroflexota bacterium]
MTATAPESIANTYAGIDDLKARMGIAGTTNDSVLWSTLNAASRAVDRYCNRHFYALEDVRMFDIEDSCRVAIPDLATATEILEDRDGDRVFETVRTASQYALYPLNAAPTSANGRPYSEIRSDLGVGVDGFAVGRSRLSIEGHWGYRYHTEETGSTVSSGGGISSTVTVVPVDAVNEIQAGMTLLIEGEQMFVRFVNGTNLTVRRGVNGTATATHADASVISFVVFPAEVSEATALLAARYWKSKDATSAELAGAAGFGPIRVRAGFDVEVEQLLAGLRKMAIGVGV